MTERVTMHLAELYYRLARRLPRPIKSFLVERGWYSRFSEVGLKEVGKTSNELLLRHLDFVDGLFKSGNLSMREAADGMALRNEILRALQARGVKLEGEREPFYGQEYFEDMHLLITSESMGSFQDVHPRKVKTLSDEGLIKVHNDLQRLLEKSAIRKSHLKNMYALHQALAKERRRRFKGV